MATRKSRRSKGWVYDSYQSTCRENAKEHTLEARSRRYRHSTVGFTEIKRRREARIRQGHSMSDRDRYFEALLEFRIDFSDSWERELAVLMRYRLKVRARRARLNR